LIAVKLFSGKLFPCVFQGRFEWNRVVVVDVCMDGFVVFVGGFEFLMRVLDVYKSE
jgi:hypothetical protein